MKVKIVKAEVVDTRQQISAIDYAPGDRVFHVCRGEGTVIDSDFEYGYVIVLFDHYSRVVLFYEGECGLAKL